MKKSRVRVEHRFAGFEIWRGEMLLVRIPWREIQLPAKTEYLPSSFRLRIPELPRFVPIKHELWRAHKARLYRTHLRKGTLNEAWQKVGLTDIEKIGLMLSLSFFSAMFVSTFARVASMNQITIRSTGQFCTTSTQVDLLQIAAIIVLIGLAILAVLPAIGLIWLLRRTDECGEIRVWSKGVTETLADGRVVALDWYGAVETYSGERRLSLKFCGDWSNLRILLTVVRRRLGLPSSEGIGNAAMLRIFSYLFAGWLAALWIELAIIRDFAPPGWDRTNSLGRLVCIGGLCVLHALLAVAARYSAEIERWQRRFQREWRRPRCRGARNQSSRANAGTRAS